MSEPLKLGDYVKLEDGRAARIIRLVLNDHCLFESEKESYMTTESYMMLKDVEGYISFKMLSSERTDLEVKQDGIKALNPINWRKANG